MKTEKIKEDIQALQDKVDAIGFKSQNEYDLHLREELALYFQSELSKQKELLEGREKECENFRNDAKNILCENVWLRSSVDGSDVISNQAKQISALKEQIEALKKERDNVDFALKNFSERLQLWSTNEMSDGAFSVYCEKFLEEQTKTPETTTKEEGREGEFCNCDLDYDSKDVNGECEVCHKKQLKTH